MVKTLERIMNEIQKRGIPEEHLHQASMLAFMEAAQATVNERIMPIPLFRVGYDTKDQTLEFSLLEGHALTKEGAQDITLLKIALASLFRDKLPLQLEGKTGVGKTYLTEQLFQAMLPAENYKILRLNANMSNVLQPYTVGTVENGLVMIKLKTEELRRNAALFIDESNRGDTNQILMLQDGTIRLPTGEGGDLGPSLPVYRNNSWELKGIRPLFVVLAQNPSVTRDAKYSGTRTTDAAQGNRNIQIDVPNAATSIGASLLMLSDEKDAHTQFKGIFKERLRSYLNLEDNLDNLEKDWLEVFAYTTNPKRTKCINTRSAVEFLDSIVCLLSRDLKSALEHEKKTINDWNKSLKVYSVEFRYDGTLIDTAESIAKVREFVQALKEEIVPRDIIKIKKLSDAISFMRKTDAAIASDNPLNTYQNARHYINISDMACALTISLYDKLERKDRDPVPIVATVLKEYLTLEKALAKNLDLPSNFSIDNDDISIYNLTIQHAVRTGKIENIIKDLANSVTVLSRNEGGNEYRKPMIARFSADLTTLAGFIHQYKDQLSPIFNSGNNINEKRRALREFYEKIRTKPSTPEIYLHRLQRVL